MLGLWPHFLCLFHFFLLALFSTWAAHAASQLCFRQTALGAVVPPPRTRTLSLEGDASLPASVGKQMRLSSSSSSSWRQVPTSLLFQTELQSSWNRIFGLKEINHTFFSSLFPLALGGRRENNFCRLFCRLLAGTGCTVGGSRVPMAEAVLMRAVQRGLWGVGCSVEGPTWFFSFPGLFSVCISSFQMCPV